MTTWSKSATTPKGGHYIKPKLVEVERDAIAVAAQLSVSVCIVEDIADAV